MSRPFTTPSIFAAETPLPTQLYRRPSKNEKDGIKRPRASKPKVKSGCITCKARRVKCDEIKPDCLRCRRFGRKCDGYTPELPPRSTAVVPIQPRLPPLSLYGPSISVAPTITIQESEEEQHYFRFFCDRTIYELAGYYDPIFWTTVVVQEAYSLAPIRYAVVAIGALNESMASASVCKGKVTDLQTVDQTHHHVAVSYYIRAIQALNQYISGSKAPQLRTALIACILFSCFETFEGSYTASHQQVTEGFKLLRSYYAGIHSRGWAAATSQASSSSIQRGNHYAAHEGNRRMDGVTTQLEHYLRLDGSERQFSEAMVDFRKPGDDFRTMNFRTQFGSSPYMYDQRTGEAVRTLADVSAGQSLDSQPGQQWNASEWPNEHSSSSDLFHAGATSIAEGLSLDPFHTNNAEYLSGEPGPSWIPQPEVVWTLSSAVSNSSASTASIHTPPSTGIQTPNRSPQPSQMSVAPPSRPPTPPVLHNDVPIEDIIIQTFVRLAGECFLYGVGPQRLPLEWDIQKLYHLRVPKYFTSLNAAHRCWDFLGDRVRRFCRRTLFSRSHGPQEGDPPATIISTYTTLIKALSDFGTALQPILDVAIEPNGNIANPLTLILSMHHKATLVVLSAATCESEMIYDSFLPTFQDIVRTASLLNSGYNASNLPLNPKFSFEVGFIPPLYVVATKCRDSVLRRQTLNLLSTNPTVEGMWDSILCARIGNWLMDIEEEGLSFGRSRGITAGSKLPAAEDDDPRTFGDGFRDTNFHDQMEPTFSYPSPPQPHNAALKNPLYDNSDGEKASDRLSTVGRYDLRHRDTSHSLPTSYESYRRRSEASLDTSNAYPSTRSRHHNSGTSASSIDSTFVPPSASTRLERHSTGTNNKRRESGVSSLSRLATVASANLASTDNPEPVIARHSSSGDGGLGLSSTINFTDINYEKDISIPTTQSQHGSTGISPDLLDVIGSYEHGVPLSQPVSPTTWTLPEGSTPRPSKKSRTGKTRGEIVAPWVVPESSRVQLTILDWHVSERYLRVVCQGALPREDGTRDERETILSW